MRKRTLILIFIAIGIISLVSPVVFAQEEGIFTAILRPLGDLGEAYEDYGVVIDTIAYLIIFLGLAEWSLGRRFREKGGRAVVAGIALVFAVSAGLWESTSGFRLASFGPIAMALFVGVLCVAVYEGLRSFEIRRGPALAWAYIVFGIIIVSMGLFLAYGEDYPTAQSIGALLFVAAIVYLILHYVKGRKAGVSLEDRFRRPFDEGAAGRYKDQVDEYKKKQADVEAELGKEEKLAEEDAALVHKVYEAVREARGKILEGGLIAPEDKKKELSEEAEAIDKAAAEMQAARGIARKAGKLAEKLKKKIKKIGDENASDDAKRMQKAASELKAIETTVWRELRGLHGKMEKGSVTSDELKDVLGKLDILYGHIDLIMKEGERIEKELETAAAQAEAGSKK